MALPFQLEEDAVVLVVPANAAVPTSDVTEPEWLALKARVAAEEAKPLAATPGVALTDPQAGQVLVLDGAGNVVNGTPPGGTLERVTGEGGSDVADARQIQTRWGITVVESSTPKIVFLQPIYGTAARTIAEGNHEHSRVAPVLAGIDGGGVLSGGTRTLYAGTLGPLASGIPYDIIATFVVTGRNNGNTGTVNLTARVGTSGTYPARTRSGLRTVGGVPEPLDIGFFAELTGAGTTVPVSFTVQFNDGDPTDLLSGEVRVFAHPRR